MMSTRGFVADTLVDTPLSSSPVMMRTATTVSMEHAVPELRITAEVRCIFYKLLYIMMII